MTPRPILGQKAIDSFATAQFEYFIGSRTAGILGLLIAARRCVGAGTLHFEVGDHGGAGTRVRGSIAVPAAVVAA